VAGKAGQSDGSNTKRLQAADLTKPVDFPRPQSRPRQHPRFAVPVAVLVRQNSTRPHRGRYPGIACNSRYPIGTPHRCSRQQVQARYCAGRTHTFTELHQDAGVEIAQRTTEATTTRTPDGIRRFRNVFIFFACTFARTPPGALGGVSGPAEHAHGECIQSDGPMVSKVGQIGQRSHLIAPLDRLVVAWYA
jgi:hypothetical protein